MQKKRHFQTCSVSSFLPKKCLLFFPCSRKKKSLSSFPKRRVCGTHHQEVAKRAPEKSDTIMVLRLDMSKKTRKEKFLPCFSNPVCGARNNFWNRRKALSRSPLSWRHNSPFFAFFFLATSVSRSRGEGFCLQRLPPRDASLRTRVLGRERKKKERKKKLFSFRRRDAKTCFGEFWSLCFSLSPLMRVRLALKSTRTTTCEVCRNCWPKMPRGSNMTFIS